MTYYSESRAMGAQWEFVRRIPVFAREKVRSEFRVLFLENLMRKYIPHFLDQDLSGEELKNILLFTISLHPDLIINYLAENCEYQEFSIAYENLKSGRSPLQSSLSSNERMISEQTVLVTLATLEFSPLNREDFLKNMSLLQGYTANQLKENHYSYSHMKGFLLGASVYLLWNMIQDHDTMNEQVYIHEVKKIPAVDLRWMLEAMGYLYFSLIRNAV
jgi:hypothetical protein